mmetsp:Transcript_82206/g.236236  ORF Transcript_82206/g.236236 Transcript_82206/m.236236 type:complete len:343 (+) Transcript_82206:570-1598(+)
MRPYCRTVAIAGRRELRIPDAHRERQANRYVAIQVVDHPLRLARLVHEHRKTRVRRAQVSIGQLPDRNDRPILADHRRHHLLGGASWHIVDDDLQATSWCWCRCRWWWCWCCCRHGILSSQGLWRGRWCSSRRSASALLGKRNHDGAGQADRNVPVHIVHQPLRALRIHHLDQGRRVSLTMHDSKLLDIGHRPILGEDSRDLVFRDLKREAENVQPVCSSSDSAVRDPVYRCRRFRCVADGDGSGQTKRNLVAHIVVNPLCLRKIAQADEGSGTRGLARILRQLLDEGQRPVLAKDCRDLFLRDLGWQIHDVQSVRGRDLCCHNIPPLSTRFHSRAVLSGPL